MKRSPGKPFDSQMPSLRPADPAAFGRILFLIAGGILLATLVSCACGPIR
jgi:hypothetical protein